ESTGVPARAAADIFKHDDNEIQESQEEEAREPPSGRDARVKPEHDGLLLPRLDFADFARNHHVIPDKRRSRTDPGSIEERGALRWIPALRFRCGRDDVVVPCEIRTP
ncbi:hypothetical protein, partial [Bosea thiooxidans]